MRCGSGGTPLGALVGGKILDVGGVAGALRQLLARTEIRETRAWIAVSDALASFRVLKLPPSVTDEGIDAAVAREFPSNPQRMTLRWMQVDLNAERRVVFATVWDRAMVSNAAEVAKGAGLEPQVVELKSACVARTVPEPSCILVDMSGNPVEIFVIDGHVPQLWHSFELNTPLGENAAPSLEVPLRQVLRFYRGRRDTDLRASSPIFISGDQVVSGQLLTQLAVSLGHPVLPLPAPARVQDDVRHGTYLTCLGLLMRRT